MSQFVIYVFGPITLLIITSRILLLIHRKLPDDKFDKYNAFSSVIFYSPVTKTFERITVTCCLA